MRFTRIDFANPAKPSSRTGVALFALGAVLAGIAVMEDSSSRDALAQSQERLERARASYKRAEKARTPRPTVEPPELKQSGDIVRRLTLPWGQLFDALERADNDKIALLAVEPDAEKTRLRLSGEAKTVSALVDYMKSIDNKGGVADLRLMTQQIKQNDAQRPIEFVLEASWLRGSQRANRDGPGL